MLKLERKNKEVNVSLRRQFRSIDRTFLIALSVATLIHLSGVIIFHVQPFKLTSIETIYPPVAVNIDFRPISNQSIITNLEERRLGHVKIDKPTLSNPTFPKVPRSATSKNFVYQRMESTKIDPFKEYETAMEKSELVKLDARSEHRDAWIISGPLGDKELKSHDAPPLAKTHIVYEVKLDDQKGRIVSIQQLSGDKNLELEKYLSSIQFENTPNGLITSGTIEFFTGGSSD